MTRAVAHTRELVRILALPVRAWGDDEAFACAVSTGLRRPGGTQTLRTIQAQALFEIHHLRGGFLPVRVGGGKTLISFLAPVVLGSVRPVLILPAKLIEKTRRDMRALAKHWLVPNHIRIMSYESLGRVNHAKDLELYRPDFIFLDESHRAKSPRAAVTKRIARYVESNADAVIVAASGTMTRKSLRDYAHILRWTLGVKSMPLPAPYHEKEDWADALDPSDDPPVEPGALAALCPQEEPTIDAVRTGYQRRLTSTPGVIVSQDSRLGTSLTITLRTLPPPPVVRDAISLLRDSWETPCGWPISDPMTIWRHARELALGMYYVWDPRPPRDWLDPRRDWAAHCRKILQDNRRQLDSELQVIQNIQHYPIAAQALEDWRAVKDTFIPNTVPVWLDDYAIDAAAAWLESGGIAWAEHTAFARRLAERSGVPYFANQGLDARGRYVEDCEPDSPAILSVKSNLEGRNLQGIWSRNLVCSPLASGLEWEQLIARTHRDGQPRDEVTVDVFMSCDEAWTSWEKALASAEYILATTGAEQKILYGDITHESI